MVLLVFFYAKFEDALENIFQFEINVIKYIIGYINLEKLIKNNSFDLLSMTF